MSPLGIEAAYERYHPAIRRFALRLVGNPDHADDLAADAWLRAWKSWPQLAPNAAVDDWVYRIVKNLVIDQGRHNQVINWQSITDCPVEPAATDSLEHQVVNRERLTGVGVVLRQLPANYRHVLALDWSGYERRETTVILSHGLGATKSLAFRARAAFTAAYAAGGN